MGANCKNEISSALRSVLTANQHRHQVKISFTNFFEASGIIPVLGLGNSNL